jgi:hypothetical protein
VQPSLFQLVVCFRDGLFTQDAAEEAARLGISTDEYRDILALVKRLERGLAHCHEAWLSHHEGRADYRLLSAALEVLFAGEPREAL